MSKNVRPAIFDAISSNNLLKVRFWLATGTKVDVRDEYKLTPLHKACIFGHKAIISLLIKKGADVNAKDEGLYTPLYFAYINNHPIEIAELLVANKADVNAVYYEFQATHTLLYHACLHNRKGMIQFLLNKGADINIDKSDWNTILRKACINGTITIVKLLLKKEVDVNVQDNEGNTPLHHACSKGYEEIAKLLLEHRAKIEATNKYEETPLFKACWNGQLDTALLMVEKGADFNKPNDYGDTPINRATQQKWIKFLDFTQNHSTPPVKNKDEKSLEGENIVYSDEEW